MKYLSFITAIFFFPITAFCQNTAHAVKSNDSNNCIHKNVYSFSNRIKNYPFNSAAEIKLVSFINNDYEEKSILLDLIRHDTTFLAKLNETVTLKLPQIDTLTDIIYNNFFRGKINQLSSALCYRPRNGILFYDNKGKLFDCIEICFECEEIKTLKHKFNFGDQCDQKFDLLRKFFVSAGINYVSSNQPHVNAERLR